MVANVTKASLTPSQQKFLTEMQRINYGRIEGLPVRRGEPVMDPPPRIFREIVYFNNREADLEKHAFVRDGRVYITLTDLMRHIGGSIIWGPDDDQMEVERNGITVELFPNSRTVYVNGVERTLDRTTLRRANRTCVPVRPFAALFGIATQWDFQDDRAYVTYAE